jgi:hypothetical protein
MAFSLIASRNPNSWSGTVFCSRNLIFAHTRRIVAERGSSRQVGNFGAVLVRNGFVDFKGVDLGSGLKQPFLDHTHLCLWRANRWAVGVLLHTFDHAFEDIL